MGLTPSIEEETGRREGKIRRCFLGDGIDSISFRTTDLPHELKKRMNRIKATCRNGCFEKMDDYPFHTIPNQYPTKVDVLPKTFVQIFLAAKWLLRHSSTSPQTTATTFAFSFYFIYSSSMTRSQSQKEEIKNWPKRGACR